jgi:enolase-phosphatase E1
MISHVLLDIEGTTCPVSFVSDILYSYATTHVEQYIDQHHNEIDIQKILEKTMEEHNQDESWQPDETKKIILSEPSKDRVAISQYLLHLIKIDKKSTPLKDLQGRIWKQGYTSGDIKSTLFSETAGCLQDWSCMGLTLAVYSSGSVEAQKLLYQYSTSGDLRSAFTYWFDTHIGTKKEKNSYRTICEQMTVAPSKVLFVSDSLDECDAAQQAGLKTQCRLCQDSPQKRYKKHPEIKNLAETTNYIKLQNL